MTDTTERSNLNLSYPESTDDKPEKKGLTSKQRIAIIMAGIALTAGIAGGVSVNALNQRQPAVAEAPANPAKPANTGEIKQEAPIDSKSFIAEYGSRYEDPLSTYYYVQSFTETNNNKSVLMSDKYIAEYDMSAEKGAISPLGFESYSISPDTKFDLSTAIELYNKYTSKELSLYMNALAQNPSPEAVAIIDSQFMDYCSNTDNTTSAADDSKRIGALMDTAKQVVKKYRGSAVGYIVAEGSTNFDNPNMSYFNEQSPTNVNTSYEKTGAIEYSNHVDSLLIEVFVFKGMNTSITREIVKDVDLTVTLQPNNSRLTIGQATVK